MSIAIEIEALSRINKQVSSALWALGAVQLGEKDAFTWTSGKKSPIYCDSRMLLSDHKMRRTITKAFKELCEKEFRDVEVVAGVATGGILYGGLLADALTKPFIYVRPQAKAHGMRKAIEGRFEKGQRVVVVEDVCSTGGSIRRAVEVLRTAGLKVCGLLAVFAYELPELKEWLEKEEPNLYNLASFEGLKQVGREKGHIQDKEYEMLSNFLAELNGSVAT